MSTAGFAGLVAGEDWHYVGEAGEPAFENSWDNVATGLPKLAFRIREAGIVDMQGVVNCDAADVGSTIFTLPTGYRPSANVLIPSIGYDSVVAPNHVPIQIRVYSASGIVVAQRTVAGASDDPELVYLYAQMFLDPPATL